MSTVLREPRLLKILKIAGLLCLAIACLLVWTRVLSLPVVADPQDTNIRDLSENRAQQLSEQHGTLCIEIVHLTPDGILLATSLQPSDSLPQDVSLLASEYGISANRVGDTFVNAERLLVSSSNEVRQIPR